MADIVFSTLTIPTPQPYDDAHPHRQRENLFYVLNQIAAQFKTNGVVLDADLTQAVLDLSYAGQEIDLPGLNIKRSGKVLTIEYTP